MCSQMPKLLGDTLEVHYPATILFIPRYTSPLQLPNFNPDVAYSPLRWCILPTHYLATYRTSANGSMHTIRPKTNAHLYCRVSLLCFLRLLCRIPSANTPLEQVVGPRITLRSPFHHQATSCTNSTLPAQLFIGVHRSGQMLSPFCMCQQTTLM